MIVSQLLLIIPGEVEEIKKIKINQLYLDGMIILRNLLVIGVQPKKKPVALDGETMRALQKKMILDGIIILNLLMVGVNLKKKMIQDGEIIKTPIIVGMLLKKMILVGEQQ